jgi:tyrosyl-tRNA synthetase
MGKSVGGAVWLNADRLAPYEFWQYWRNSEDADVGRFLRIFTEMSLDEIARLEALKGAELNEAKKILATEITKLCHGEAAANEAAETARRTFEEGALAETLPTVDLPRARLEGGLPAFELFADAKLAESRSEARRLIKGGGARVNDKPVASDTTTVSLADADGEGRIKLSAGRKRHVLVRAV